MAEAIIKVPKIFALCGKGGVGKTTISASMVRILMEQGAGSILAIDADPAVGLAAALGVHPRRTVDDIRNGLIDRIEKGNGGDRREIIELLDYEVLNALEERDNLAFLAIGRPEKEGCYCQVNDFLKDIIEAAAKNFDYVIIDGEAGIEQVNRRVMERVTHLILVSDASLRGINVAGTIRAVAEKAMTFETAGLILNRVRSGEEAARISIPPDLSLLGWVPENDSIRACDIRGQSIFDMTDTAALDAVRECMSKFRGCFR